MNKNKYITVLIALFAIAVTSCDKFLDVLPDKRAEINSQDKIRDLLVSAYNTNTYLTFAEYMSDNVENLGDDVAGRARIYDQMYSWAPITDTDNDDPKSFWENCYYSIAHANMALEAIEELGGVEATGMYAEMAEALVCRAYAHFMLVNVFCQNYNAQTSYTDLGVPYMTWTETELKPHYDRGTVAEVYQHIDDDLQAALPYISDSYYKVPKYHFNPKAAYAFAARFYLFYEKWDKAAEYATKCLGSQPGSVLRDWEARGKLVSDEDVLCNDFIRADQNCNLLLLTAYTQVGWYFVYAGAPKYSHTTYIAATETCFAKNVWGNTDIGWGNTSNYYYDAPDQRVGSGCSQITFNKIPYLFEYTDPVAGIGFAHTVLPAFTTDEVLLNRAEAYILMGEYNLACDDLNTWVHNVIKTSKFNGTLTPDSIKSFYDAMPYAKWDNYDKKTREIQNNIKKKLNPKFEIPSDRYAEPMLQCVLQFKRIENICQGLRWFDIKRYGIEIWRRTLVPDASNPFGYSPLRCDDVLKVDDPRRAVQIPQDVISAGLQPNPRD